MTAPDPLEDGAADASPEQPPVDIEPIRVVESILFASDAPLPAAKIATIVGVGDARDMKKHIAALNEQYGAAGLSFRIEEIAGGFRMLTLPAYNTWLAKLLRAREETKLSQAAMETLAIVAYKQPVTRAEVDAIRGANSGLLLRVLIDRGLVRTVGRAELPGAPFQYGTTKQFLRHFGLRSLAELPGLDDLKRLAQEQLA
jgi:segregation and condensation protein B